ncbi:MAG: sigma-70 family RNA polymerase sigma factor [Clostridia bacterium]
MLMLYLNLCETDSDKQKMEQLYNRYNGLIYSIAFGMLSNKQDAEDAMHETFLRILGHLEKLSINDSHKTKAYIVIACENICRDVLRKRKKIDVVSLDEWDRGIHSPIDTEDEIIETSSVSEMHSAIHSLAPIHKEIIILKYAKDLSDKEIATFLKISASAARKRLERARKALASKLSSDEVI